MTAVEPLTPAARKALKARAHALEPVVWIGEDGPTDAVVAEIERALAAHELIKVRAAGMGREAREAAMARICARCAAQPVQHIGKVLVLYRKKPAAGKAAPQRKPRASGSRSRGSPRAGRAMRSASRRRA